MAIYGESTVSQCFHHKVHNVHSIFLCHHCHTPVKTKNKEIVSKSVLRCSEPITKIHDESFALCGSGKTDDISVTAKSDNEAWNG